MKYFNILEMQGFQMIEVKYLCLSVGLTRHCKKTDFAKIGYLEKTTKGWSHKKFHKSKVGDQAWFRGTGYGYF